MADALSLRPDEIDKVYVLRGSESTTLKRIVAVAHRVGVPVQYVPRRRLDLKAGGTPHQGVVAAVAEIAYRDLDDLLATLGVRIGESGGPTPLLVVLDGIQDPQNLGAILRTAAAAGVAGVVVPLVGSAPIAAATVKASAGTAGMVPVARVRKLSDALTQLKERGFWIVGLSADGADTIWEVNWIRPVAVVVGSEGKGLARPVERACDNLARIPMAASVDSLNVSVAAGITLFAALHCRATGES